MVPLGVNQRGKNHREVLRFMQNGMVMPGTRGCPHGGGELFNAEAHPLFQVNEQFRKPDSSTRVLNTAELST